MSVEYLLPELLRDAPPSHCDYTLACICLMGIELAPLKALLEEHILVCPLGAIRTSIRWGEYEDAMWSLRSSPKLETMQP